MEFQGFPKIPRYENETFTITEKIDGTNAAIVFPDHHLASGEFFVQSRKRLITPDDDNYGFATWVYENVDELFDILGPGRHFGEWWGQGIQRRYDQPTKRFSLFNTHRWGELSEKVGGIPLDSVPVMGHGSICNLEWTVNHCQVELDRFGSVAAPGFRNPEGCMIYLHQLNTYLKAPLERGHKGQADS